MSKTSSQPDAADRPSDNDVADALSLKLKTYYADLSSEVLPDRFLDLLTRLDEAAAKRPDNEK